MIVESFGYTLICWLSLKGEKCRSMKIKMNGET
jgi:hypothetical protein